MKAASRTLRVGSWGRGYTLVELVCSVGIVILLAALLLPAVRNGYAKVQRLYCVNNLHEMGLAFHSFALGHQDRFPMQVSTNEGGSLEFLQAANTMSGEFFFSYRHFSPLSNELATPKVMNCPSDTRDAATNFAEFRNENLSYFAAGNPEPANANSALAGNRNITPVYGSVAQVGGYRYLRWTEELHRFKGNVLFGDGHVDQLNDVFSITNSGAATVARLQMPSVREPAPLAGGAGQYGYVGSRPRGGNSALSIPPGFANLTGTNYVITNWWVSGERSVGSQLAFPESDNRGPGAVSRLPTSRSSPPLAAAPRQTGPEPPASGLKEVYRKVVAKAQAMLREAALVIYDIPWYLLLLFLVGLIELRRRLRARQRITARRPAGTTTP